MVALLLQKLKSPSQVLFVTGSLYRPSLSVLIFNAFHDHI